VYCKPLEEGFHVGCAELPRITIAEPAVVLRFDLPASDLGTADIRCQRDCRGLCECKGRDKRFGQPR
jgi:hypothetical protein